MTHARYGIVERRPLPGHLPGLPFLGLTSDFVLCTPRACPDRAPIRISCAPDAANGYGGVFI